MSAWIIYLSIFLAGGGVGTTVALLMRPAPVAAPVPPVVVDNSAATVQAETAKELSNLDLVAELCDPEYIATAKINGDGACREIFCWQQTNSTTGEAGALACEPISNLNNTHRQMQICGQFGDPGSEAFDSCWDAFRERK